MNKKIFCTVIFYFFLTLAVCFSQAGDNKNTWVIAAEKFTYSKGQTQNAVTDATAESFPIGILEKLGESLNRTILPDEQMDRISYDLRKERISLYLQLSSEYKKRDAVFLNDYSDRELKNKLNEIAKNIKTIQNKIEENLTELKKEEEKTAEKQKIIESGNYNFSDAENSEAKKYSEFFKHLIMDEEEIVTSENIVLYKKDSTVLYQASEKNKKEGYDSYEFETEMMNAHINTLLTGLITSYGDYTQVSVTAYSYPGGKKIGTVTEVGSLQEMELLVTSLSRQLVPIITNALPVIVNFDVNPKDSNVLMYVDDVLQQSVSKNMIFNSGVHTIQFVCEGYDSISTSYFFEGNRKYEIEVNLQPEKDGFIKLGLLKPLDGVLYANGIVSESIDARKSKIKINGKAILGEFVADDGKTDFYYVSEKLIGDGKQLVINPKTRDRNEYIDSRRKWMYGSYSALIVSLMPAFYSYGNYYNYAMLYNNERFSTEENYNKALKWQGIYRGCTVVSVCCGVFFIYELIRYFNAANSVLPQKAKVANKKQQYIFDYIPPDISEIPISVAETENSESDSLESENVENHLIQE